MRVWHDSNPRSQGAVLDVFKKKMSAQHELMLVDNRFSELVKAGVIKIKNGSVSLSKFQSTIEANQSEYHMLIEAAIRQCGLKIPSLGDLKSNDSLKHANLERMLWSLVKSGRLHAFGRQRFVSSETLHDLAKSISSLSMKMPEFSIVDVKKHIGIGRNLTVELMEYFDLIRFTARKGNCRTVIDHELPKKLLKKK